MNGLFLAYRNLQKRPLNTCFNIVLIALTSGLISLSLIINKQFESHFTKNLGFADLVITAKGSPLQAVLCNLFHIDVPTGNIPLSECKVFMSPNHPLIKTAIPLALGDQYAGFRIVGTTLEYFNAFQLQVQQGSLFQSDFQAVIGSEIAAQSGLKPGDSFLSGHGLVSDSLSTHEHTDQHFTVTGILHPSGTIADRLVFVSISSYWMLHHDDLAENHLEHHHGPPCLTNMNIVQTEGAITSLLLEFKGTNIQSLNFGRNINENTNLMAANPAIELNRLYELTGTASELLELLVLLLIILAFLSLFISLWQAMEERKYEIALLRLGGASPFQLLRWNMLESLMLGFIGLVLGIVSAHILLLYLSPALKLDSRYGITGNQFYFEEVLILLIGCSLAVFAALIPVFRALKKNIHYTLTSA